MKSHATAIDTVHAFSTDTIRKSGSIAYADIGDAVLRLGRQPEAQTRLGLSYEQHASSGRSIVGWLRELSDGSHHLILSDWAERSYMLQDVRLPKGKEHGFLRAYLFGSDTVITGLRKAYRVLPISDVSDIPAHNELEQMIRDYGSSPSRSRHTLIDNRQAQSIFVRLIKSVDVTRKEQ